MSVTVPGAGIGTTEIRLTAPGESLAADWFKPTLLSLVRMLLLPRGWDTFAARSIAPESVEHALAFLAHTLHPTSAPPAVVPLSDGGIQLEWHRGGLDVEVTFSPDGEPALYVADLESGHEWELNPESEEVEEVRPLLHRLDVVAA